MEISSFPQWQIFIYCLAWGTAAGALYDVFRFLRKAGLNSIVALVVEDVLYMCLCAVWLFLIASALNFGEIRAYMSAAFFCGAVVYRFTIGVLSGKMFDRIISAATKVFRAIKRVIKRLFSFLCKQTSKISVIFCFLHKNYREKSKNSLQDKSGRVYNNKKQFLTAKLIGRRSKREGSSSGNGTGKKTEKKA